MFRALGGVDKGSAAREAAEALRAEFERAFGLKAGKVRSLSAWAPPDRRTCAGS
jgi:hypothetical protein